MKYEDLPNQLNVYLSNKYGLSNEHLSAYDFTDGTTDINIESLTHPL